MRRHCYTSCWYYFN